MFGNRSYIGKIPKKKTTIDNAVLTSSAVLAIDSIIAPFVTGHSLHQILRIPPSDDYKVWHSNALMAERAIWGVSLLYHIARDSYKIKHNRQPTY